MSLSKLAANPTKTTAKAIDPEPVVTEAQPAPTESNALALMPEGGTVTVADALNAALSTETSSAGNRFGIVNLTGGPSGGMFAPASFLPQEVQDALPSGKKPIPGVLMGYRVAVSAWASGYTDQGSAPKEEGKSKPVYAASVSANDLINLPIAMKAARNYQFTKSADKSKFDYATSKAGHIRIAVELLVYQPEIGQPIVISTPTNYGAVEATLLNVQKLVDSKTGALGQFPCMVRPVTVDKSSKGGYSWKEHSLDISNTAGTAESKTTWDSFNAWRTEALKDAATVHAVREWLSAQDRKVTGDIAAALKAAASL